MKIFERDSVDTYGIEGDMVDDANIVEVLEEHAANDVEFAEHKNEMLAIGAAIDEANVNIDEGNEIVTDVSDVVVNNPEEVTPALVVATEKHVNNVINRLAARGLADKNSVGSGLEKRLASLSSSHRNSGYGVGLEARQRSRNEVAMLSAEELMGGLEGVLGRAAETVMVGYEKIVKLMKLVYEKFMNALATNFMRVNALTKRIENARTKYGNGKAIDKEMSKEDSERIGKMFGGAECYITKKVEVKTLTLDKARLAEYHTAVKSLMTYWFSFGKKSEEIEAEASTAPKGADAKKAAKAAKDLATAVATDKAFNSLFGVTDANEMAAFIGFVDSTIYGVTTNLSTTTGADKNITSDITVTSVSAKADVSDLDVKTLSASELIDVLKQINAMLNAFKKDGETAVKFISTAVKNIGTLRKRRKLNGSITGADTGENGIAVELRIASKINDVASLKSPHILLSGYRGLLSNSIAYAGIAATYLEEKPKK